MQVSADLQVIPIGSGASLRPQVMRAIDLLKEFDLELHTHAMGTNLKGEMAEVLAAVAAVHDTLHREGTIRIVSNLKLATRTDK